MTALDIARGIGYLTVAEVDAIKQVTRSLNHNAQCVNIGSGAGTSVIAVLEERTDLHLFDIDINLSNGAPQLKETGYLNDDRLTRIEGDSKDVGASWDLPIDYLFIDGDHSDAGIRGDIEAWVKWVRIGGFILVHDYHPYPPGHALEGIDYWPDVKRVTDELIHLPVALDSDRLRVFGVIV